MYCDLSGQTTSQAISCSQEAIRKQHSIEQARGGSQPQACPVRMQSTALFLGHPHCQHLIACSMQKGGNKALECWSPGEREPSLPPSIFTQLVLFSREHSFVFIPDKCGSERGQSKLNSAYNIPFAKLISHWKPHPSFNANMILMLCYMYGDGNAIILVMIKRVLSKISVGNAESHNIKWWIDTTHPFSILVLKPLPGFRRLQCVLQVTKCWEGLGNVLQATESWERLGDVLQATESWEGLGDVLQATESWEGLGDVLQATESWEGSDNVLQTTESWEGSGNEAALSLLHHNCYSHWLQACFCDQYYCTVLLYQ